MIRSFKNLRMIILIPIIFLMVFPNPVLSKSGKTLKKSKLNKPNKLNKLPRRPPVRCSVRCLDGCSLGSVLFEKNADLKIPLPALAKFSPSTWPSMQSAPDS